MSTWTSIKRVTRYGFVGFIRNGFVSLAAVLIMCVTLFMVANILLSRAAMQHTLTEISNQVGVTVYFKTDADVNQVTNMQKALQQMPQVTSVDYTSSDQALAQFKDRHKDDQLTLQALSELGVNPLGASLTIRAKETSEYQGIADYLASQQKNATGASIDKINFNQNKGAIDLLTSIISTSERNDLAKAAVLAICSLLIAFNTIRLIIYTARDEIGVMNLVGAGHWYVRGPFIVAGVLYGGLSAVIILAVLYPILLSYPVAIGLDPASELLFGAFNSFQYYTSHFVFFFAVLVGTGIGLGVVSSYLAVRRYLRM